MRKCTAKQFEETAEKVLAKYAAEGRILGYEISDDYSVRIRIQRAPQKRKILMRPVPEKTALVEFRLDKSGMMVSSHENLEILDKSTLIWILKNEDRIAGKLLEGIHGYENENAAGNDGKKKGFFPQERHGGPNSDRSRPRAQRRPMKRSVLIAKAAELLAENEGLVRIVQITGKDYTENGTYKVHDKKLIYQSVRENKPVVCGIDETVDFLQKWIVTD